MMPLQTSLVCLGLVRQQLFSLCAAVELPVWGIILVEGRHVAIYMLWRCATSLSVAYSVHIATYSTFVRCKSDVTCRCACARPNTERMCLGVGLAHTLGAAVASWGVDRQAFSVIGKLYECACCVCVEWCNQHLVIN